MILSGGISWMTKISYCFATTETSWCKAIRLTKYPGKYKENIKPRENETQLSKSLHRML